VAAKQGPNTLLFVSKTTSLSCAKALKGSKKAALFGQSSRARPAAPPEPRDELQALGRTDRSTSFHAPTCSRVTSSRRSAPCSVASQWSTRSSSSSGVPKALLMLWARPVPCSADCARLLRARKLSTCQTGPKHPVVHVEWDQAYIPFISVSEGCCAPGT
jgi:hypothetical protein